MTQNNRRVAITGLGIVSPLGNTIDELWQSLLAGRSGVDVLQRIPPNHLPSGIGGEARDFAGRIEDFGDLEKSLKRTIKKGLKLMCREIEMGVAAAQFAIAQAGLHPHPCDPARIGTLFGTDYIITQPSEFSSGIHNCSTNRKFDFSSWVPTVYTKWSLYGC